MNYPVSQSIGQGWFESVPSGRLPSGSEEKRAWMRAEASEAAWSSVA